MGQVSFKKIMKHLLKDFIRITKFGIVIFVLLTASAGYFLSLNEISIFSTEIFLFFLVGLYLVSSGSFVLNQSQEWRLDQKMERTKRRPIARGSLSPLQGYVLAFTMIVFGGFLLFLLKPLTSFLALLTVFLYNVFYTLFWKKRLSHGAVFGAIPGALPPVIGYSLSNNNLFSTECVYLFLLMFLWQMPHFWSLAIRYKEDYNQAGVPVLPVIYGFQKTIYEMGFYMLAYVGLALISPLFLRAGLMYIFLLCPLVLKIIYEFYHYLNHQTKWLRFFLWINLSIIVYLSVPIMDKWFFYLVYE